MWRTVCQSVIGRFHLETGLPCQDYGACQILDSQVLIGAVADGAGSAKHSDLGAQIAVEAALDFLETVNTNSEIDLVSEPLATAEELKKVFEQVYPKLVAFVLEKLQAEAESNNYALADLACTLLVFVVTPDWLAAMQIGDGFILIKPVGDDYQLLFQPDKGEYINETTFITSKNALEEMQIKVLEKPVAFLCAATDGVESVSVNYRNWQPFSPFFKPLELYLQDTEHPLDKDLKEFLEREELNARTTDDKTLLLALWSDQGD